MKSVDEQRKKLLTQEAFAECTALLELSLVEDWEETHRKRAGGKRADDEMMHQYHSDQAVKHRKAAQQHANSKIPSRISSSTPAPEWKSPSSKRKGQRHVELMHAHQYVADNHETPEPRRKNIRWDTVSDQ